MLSIEDWQLWSDLSFFPDAPPTTLRKLAQPQLMAWETELGNQPTLMEVDRKTMRFSGAFLDRARALLIRFRSRDEVLKLKMEASQAHSELLKEKDGLVRLFKENIVDYKFIFDVVAGNIQHDVDPMDTRYTVSDRFAHNEARKALRDDGGFVAALNNAILGLAGDPAAQIRAVENFKLFIDQSDNLKLKIYFYQVVASEQIDLLHKVEEQNEAILQKTNTVKDAEVRVEKLQLTLDNLAESNRCADLASRNIGEAIAVIESEFLAYMYLKAKNGSVPR